MNFEKTRIYMSNNVNHTVAKDICSSSSFTLSGDLSRYLGLPLHHKRVSKRTYHFTVDKV